MNLFACYNPAAPEEQIDVLRQTSAVRIERIVSTGQVSPSGFWYDQEEDEWVAVLQGEGRIETESGVLVLRPGDTAFLPAHFRHRVSFTSADPACVWLCIFSKKGEAP